MIRNASTIILLASSMLLTACNSIVTDGGGTGGSDETPTGGTGGDGGSGGGGNIPPPPSTPAVAMTRAKLDQLWEEYWKTHDPSGSSSSTGGDDLDPNDLFLQISDLGASCSSPTTDLTCGGHWEVSVALPPAFQHVGLFDLEDPGLVSYSYMSETGQPNSPAPEDCPWGGGSLGGGTVEILSIDATEVHFRLILSGGLWDSDPSGEYTAPLCP